MAKLSGLWAGVNPNTLSQNAAPSGVLSAVLGRVTAALEPVSAPSAFRGNCNRDPEVMVTAAQSLPTAICAAEGSDSATTPPSTPPDGQAWLSAQFAPTTNKWSSVSATESGFAQLGANPMVPSMLM